MALKDEIKSDVVDVQKGIKVVFDALLAQLHRLLDNALDITVKRLLKDKKRSR